MTILEKIAEQLMNEYGDELEERIIIFLAKKAFEFIYHEMKERRKKMSE